MDGTTSDDTGFSLSDLASSLTDSIGKGLGAGVQQAIGNIGTRSSSTAPAPDYAATAARPQAIGIRPSTLGISLPILAIGVVVLAVLLMRR